TGVTVEAVSGGLSLLAGDRVIVQAGATVQTPATLLFNGGFNDIGDGGGVTLLGTVTGSAVNALGGSGMDSFLINADGTGMLTANGAAGADTYDITPSASRSITVNDGGPGGVDRFNYDAQ